MIWFAKHFLWGYYIFVKHEPPHESKHSPIWCKSDSSESYVVEFFFLSNKKVCLITLALVYVRGQANDVRGQANDDSG